MLFNPKTFFREKPRPWLWVWIFVGVGLLWRVWGVLEHEGKWWRECRSAQNSGEIAHMRGLLSWSSTGFWEATQVKVREGQQWRPLLGGYAFRGTAPGSVKENWLWQGWGRFRCPVPRRNPGHGGGHLPRISFTAKRVEWAKAQSINLCQRWAGRGMGLGKGWALAVWCGDRTQLPSDFQQAMRVVGASHALAQSGQHVGIFCLLLQIFFGSFRRLRRIPGMKFVTRLLAVGILFAFSGQPSVKRVCGFLGCIWWARCLGVHSTPTRILMISAIILLLIQPTLLSSAGFWLSVVATFWLVSGRLNFSRILWMPLWMTPWVAYFFGEVSFGGWFLSWPVSALLGVSLIPLGFLWPLLGALRDGGSGEILQSVMAMEMGWITRLAEWARGAFGTVPQFVLVEALLWCAFVGFLKAYRDSKKP